MDDLTPPTAVTVVVPAYNAEATLGRALDSLLAQTLESWEAVVVDDGSRDETAALAARYAGRDARIRLLSHSHNRGVAAAQNSAMAAARGEWVTRLDADDTMPPNALATLMAAAGDQADVVWGRCRNGSPLPADASLNSLPVCVDSFSLWAKLCRRRLMLEAPCWESLDRWEDLSVWARVLARKPRVAFVDAEVYDYRQPPRQGNTLSTAVQWRVLADHIEIARRLDLWFAEHGLDAEFEEFLLHIKFAAKVKMLRCNPRKPMLWRRTFREVNGRIMGLRHVPLRYRLLFSLFAIGAMGPLRR